MKGGHRLCEEGKQSSPSGTARAKIPREEQANDGGAERRSVPLSK